MKEGFPTKEPKMEAGTRWERCSNKRWTTHMFVLSLPPSENPSNHIDLNISELVRLLSER